MGVVMDFEEWLKGTRGAVGSEIPEYMAKWAYEAGIQEGIDRMYRLYDICPECSMSGGQHKMDCGRQR